MYTKGTMVKEKEERLDANKKDDSIITEDFTFPALDSVDSPQRAHLKTCSREIKQQVFFYNEANPHIGMLLNIKHELYNFFQTVGPVKDSWLQILQKDCDLTSALRLHIPRGPDDSPRHTTDAQEKAYIPLATLVYLINTLECKKNVSCSKYKGAVTDNLLQLRRGSLSAQELAALRVLAQYSYFNYEII
jgi:hypothetical protein